jgi:AraC-like DNA-binding protein
MGREAPRIGMPRTGAVLAQIVSGVFQELGLSAALTDGATWYAIHAETNAIRFEINHGVERSRWLYNERSMAEVRRTRRPLLGRYAGLSDLFVPFRSPEGACGVLVAGPFALARPTSGDIVARWASVIGTPVRRSDPELLRYASTALTTLTFDAATWDKFKRLLRRFASLLEGRPGAKKLTREIDDLRSDLLDLRRFERVSALANELVSEQTTHDATSIPDLQRMGLDRAPEHAMVGLLLDKSDDADPIDRLVRRDAFQRECYALCIRRKGTLSGQVGEAGIVLLAGDRGGLGPVRARLGALAERVRVVAKRFGFALHVGIAPSNVAESLPSRYQAALAAAEEGIARGAVVTHAEPKEHTPIHPLRELRAKIARVVRDAPKLVAPAFDRYLRAAVVHYGYRIEAIRAHMDAVFDTIIDAARSTGALEERSLLDVEQSLVHAAREAGTVREIASAYDKAIADLSSSLVRPAEGRRNRGLERAVTFVRDHFAESLPLDRVARVAGFAPTYFSRLFVERQGVTFQVFLRGLRLDHARQLLGYTALSVEHVARLSGFPSRNFFYLAFKRTVGETPAAWRSRRKHTIVSTREAWQTASDQRPEKRRR